MTTSAFGSTIQFLNSLGAFDVLFPFLLIFTLVYGVLEKTKVLGTIDSKNEGEPKHNLNAMVAFTLAFLTVATPGIVNFLNFIAVWVVVILLTLVFLIFLLFAVNPNAHQSLSSSASKIAFSITLVGIIVLIFLIGFFKDRDTGAIRRWLSSIFTSDVINTIIFLVVIIILMLIVVKGGSQSQSKEKKKTD